MKKRIFKKNKSLAKERGYDRHYYLEKLGIPIEKCGTNFCGNDDKRYSSWMKERKKYGFDSRETWCLEHIFYEWLYERLKMYKKEASKIVDLSFHKFKINEVEYTQIEAINKMIELLEKILISISEYDDDTKEVEDYKKTVLRIWSEVLPAMWW